MSVLFDSAKRKVLWTNSTSGATAMLDNSTSCSFWIKVHSWPTGSTEFLQFAQSGYTESGSTNECHISFKLGYPGQKDIIVRGSIADGSQVKNTEGDDLTLGTWYLIVLTRAADGLVRWYQSTDTAFDTPEGAFSACYRLDAAMAMLSIGKGWAFDGTGAFLTTVPGSHEIASLQVWDAELTTAQMVSIYNGGVPDRSPTASGATATASFPFQNDDSDVAGTNLLYSHAKSDFVDDTDLFVTWDAGNSAIPNSVNLGIIREEINGNNTDFLFIGDSFNPGSAGAWSHMSGANIVSKLGFSNLSVIADGWHGSSPQMISPSFDLGGDATGTVLSNHDADNNIEGDNAGTNFTKKFNFPAGTNFEIFTETTPTGTELATITFQNSADTDARTPFTNWLEPGTILKSRVFYRHASTSGLQWSGITLTDGTDATGVAVDLKTGKTPSALESTTEITLDDQSVDGERILLIQPSSGGLESDVYFDYSSVVARKVDSSGNHVPGMGYLRLGERSWSLIGWTGTNGLNKNLVAADFDTWLTGVSFDLGRPWVVVINSARENRSDARYVTDTAGIVSFFNAAADSVGRVRPKFLFISQPLHADSAGGEIGALRDFAEGNDVAFYNQAILDPSNVSFVSLYRLTDGNFFNSDTSPFDNPPFDHVATDPPSLWLDQNAPLVNADTSTIILDSANNLHISSVSGAEFFSDLIGQEMSVGSDPSNVSGSSGTFQRKSVPVTGNHGIFKG